MHMTQKRQRPGIITCCFRGDHISWTIMGMYCNGFTYATGEAPFSVQLIFPYFPLIDAIALGTCGGGNFYLDCSGLFHGRGYTILLFSYRWTVHASFFIVSFIHGMQMLIITGQRRSRGGPSFARNPNPYIDSSLIRKKRCLLVCCGIGICTSCSRLKPSYYE